MRSKHLTTLIGLIVIAALFFSGGRPAAAQAKPRVSAVGEGGGQSVGAQVVLYDQMDSPGGSISRVSSQNFLGSDAQICSILGLSSHCYDSEAADDFVVPPGGGVLSWTIDKVEVTGTYVNYNYSSGDTVIVNVKFYYSTGLVPGLPAYQDNYIPTAASLASGSYVINLTRPVALQVGQSYWVEVQANLFSAGQGGQWYWGERTVLSNQLSAWRNGGGANSSCTSWTTRVPACGGDSNPDLLFRLSGNTNNNLLFLPIIRR